jgi:hypothetical protein
MLASIVVGLGATSALLAFVISGYAVLRRPELLRSERHTMAQSYLEWLRAGDQDESVRQSASKVILSLAEPAVPKRLSSKEGRKTNG